MIFAVMHSTEAVEKIKPEKIQYVINMHCVTTVLHDSDDSRCVDLNYRIQWIQPFWAIDIS